MKLSHQFAIIFSITFSVLLALILVFIYTEFTDFREDEFARRLDEKAESTVLLLADVREVDRNMLTIIDQHTINRLYNEKTLVFDDSLRLIYTSIDDATLTWRREDLEHLREGGSIFVRNGIYETFGRKYTSEGRIYYVLIKAEDETGNRKLEYLKYLLLAAFGLGTFAVWIISFYVSDKSLKKLAAVADQIREVTVKNLDTRLPVTDSKQNEINQLSVSFNEMLDRIEQGYLRQKEFSGNASHELRTPVARLAGQVENILADPALSPPNREALSGMLEDIHQLAELVSSLLLLSRVERHPRPEELSGVRLDELVFSSFSKLKTFAPRARLHFEIENLTDQEPSLDIRGDETLLGIAIYNLLKNAITYSSDGHVTCLVRQTPEALILRMDNTGEIPEGNPDDLFEPLRRGSNARHTPGSGLGLRIVQRILRHHHARISYQTPDDHTNRLEITFPR